jgi:hypothetical protein
MSSAPLFAAPLPFVSYNGMAPPERRRERFRKSCRLARALPAMSSRLLITIAPLRGAAIGTVLLFAPSWIAPAAAQPPADRFEAKVKFSDGRLVCDSADLVLSDAYRRRLRPGVKDDDLKRQFIEAVNRQFELMPKLYFYTLGNTAGHDEVSLDKAGALHDPDIDRARHWNMGWDGFPRLEEFIEDMSAFERDLDQVSGHSGLLRYAPPDTDNLKTMPRRFEVRDVLIVSELAISPPTTIPGDRKLRQLLAPLDRLPANPEQVQRILLNYYAGIGITPRIEVQLDRPSKKVTIIEGTRIGRLLVDNAVTAAQALHIAYEALPDRAFRAFRTSLDRAMATPVDDKHKRVFDIAELVAAAETPDRARTFKLPLIDPAGLQSMQQRLLTLGFQASLFDLDPDKGLVDLVVDPTTPQEGAATVAQPLTGTAKTPASSSPAVNRPGAPTDIEPAGVVPETGDVHQASQTARLDKRNYIGGGVRYFPEQGVRWFVTTHRMSRTGLDLLSAEGGQQNDGFGAVEYQRDYIAFSTLGRRLALSARSGTDVTINRILAGIPTDERRTGGGAHLELELFRDWSGSRFVVSADGHYETVRLMPQGGIESATDLTTTDLGLSFERNVPLRRHPATLRVLPSLRVGWLTGVSYTRLNALAAYHLSIAGPVESDFRLHGVVASDDTPVFELPSLGGEETTRGFRADQVFGRRLWSAQSEIWLPLGSVPDASTFVANLVRNLRLAGFYDVGEIDPVFGAPGGLRQGAGAGLRLRYQGVVFALDVGHGFGADALDPGNRLYFNVRLP